MFAILLIGLREGLEAALVVGILVAYLTKVGRRDVLPRLWIGVGAAVATSLLVGAILTFGPSTLSFQAQEIIGGTFSLIAVAMVTWMIIWMARHGSNLTSELTDKADVALRGGAGGLVALGVVSVGREGIETALFVWAASTSNSNAALGLGSAVLGILIAIALAYLIFRGLIRINLSRFFLWTGVFLVFVAAGVFAYGLGDLQEASVLPTTGPAFSLANVVPATSWYGQLLGGIFGFTPEPTWLQVTGWLVYFAVVMTVFLIIQLRPRVRTENDIAPTPVPSGNH
jgi:high-affinity iron transporter